MYVITKVGGKQVKVEVGQAIYVEKLDVEIREKVVFNEVISVDGKPTKVGAPTVAGAATEGTVEKYDKQKKIITFKYRPKRHLHRKQGHRQPYIKVVIDTISA